MVFEGEGDGSGGSGSGGSPGRKPDPAGSTGAIGTVAAQTGTGSSTQGVGGFGALTVTRVEAKMTADCMPVVGPDPMNGSVLVEYSNDSDAVGSLTLTRADVIFSNRVEGWVFPVDLMLISIVVPPGETVTVEHLKGATDGDSSFVCQLCGAPGSVTLYFSQEDGTELVASGPLDLPCAL